MTEQTAATPPASIQALRAEGVSLWLDDLTRSQLESGELAKLQQRFAITGITTNPTIFANAVRHDTTGAYQQQLQELAARQASAAAAVQEITVRDVQQAADLFADIHAQSGGTDGRVSLEVDPRSANDAAATVQEAAELWQLVDRGNLLIKIPATTAGLTAITQTLAAGMSVNVTLIFSPDRYREVLEAWLDGLELAQAHGHDLAKLESVASFFISRVDTEVDARLEQLGTESALALRGQAALANARVAYGIYQQILASPRWQRLVRSGAKVQRPLWASTGVKNPQYSPTLYVDELVVAGTVNTLPHATLSAAAEQSNVRGDRVTPHISSAREILEAISATGIDFPEVFAKLEDEGVTKFIDSWEELLTAVDAALAEHTRADS